MTSFWRSPVYILFAATAVVLIANGSRQSFGLFLEPISTDLNWGVTEFAFAIAAQNLIMGMAAPFTGALADRYMRPTTVIALSAALYTAGLALISVSVTPETMFLSAGVIVGLGASGVGLTLPLGIVGRVAPEKSRTLWLGIVTAGGSAGQFTFGLTANGLIDGFGWAGGLVGLAIIVAVAVPLAYSMRWAGDTAFSKPDTETLGGALKKASGHRGYWLLVMGFFVCGFQVQFVGTHLPIGRGCYLFAMRAGKGMTPWYVGQSKGCFKLEVFAKSKQAHYNAVRGNYKKGKPMMFLVIRLTKGGRLMKGKLPEPEANYVERFLISEAFQKNPDLMNIKGVSFSKNLFIPGIINDSRASSKLDDGTKELMSCLGMA